VSAFLGAHNLSNYKSAVRQHFRVPLLTVSFVHLHHSEGLARVWPSSDEQIKMRQDTERLFPSASWATRANQRSGSSFGPFNWTFQPYISMARSASFEYYPPLPRRVACRQGTVQYSNTSRQNSGAAKFIRFSVPNLPFRSGCPSLKSASLDGLDIIVLQISLRWGAASAGLAFGSNMRHFYDESTFLPRLSTFALAAPF